MRLDRALHAAATGRLTVVQAPAGYGKTTAVASWLRASARPAAWVALDRHDNEARRLVEHLVAAAAGALPASVRAARYAAFPDPGKRIHAQIALLSAELAPRADAARRGSSQTDAELRVLAELARGSTRAQIAATLHLSESTVKAHLRRLYRRLGADIRVAALAAARERGLLAARDAIAGEV